MHAVATIKLKPNMLWSQSPHIGLKRPIVMDPPTALDKVKRKRISAIVVAARVQSTGRDSAGDVALAKATPVRGNVRTKRGSHHGAAGKSVSRTVGHVSVVSKCSPKTMAAQKAWDEKFNMLFNFSKEHGHARPPLRLDTDKYPKLGCVCTVLRCCLL